ncbi:oligosaccharide flippase family protein [Paenibacillus sp. JNUCC31]|uniref:oligosaccharide flippase family protein n=1 Tax=Paenibacillus sp. JNUCC-31 TaxID=2777983 RepID=UPI0017856BD8|nr:oligosaccharide flippase family protein [Paenibacillus sp. JNUCC-31]QOS78131.1 oligosaccharide flippase family protein [Paenibacillus sp. JNUCC-31]
MNWMNIPPGLKQTGIRIGAVSLVKAMGLIGRIILTRMAGPEGIGLFQIAYSYFGFMLMLITGGLPTSLAMYTARQPALGWIWFKRLSVLLVLIGGTLCLLTLAYSSSISRWLGNPVLEPFIRSLSLAIFVVPLLNLLRGYLQGLEHYGVIAVSELMEQAVRIGIMLGVTWLWLPKGVMFAVGRSLIGTAIGGIAAFVVLLLFLRHVGQKNGIQPLTPTGASDGLWLIKSSLVISVTRLLIPFSDMLDAIIIPLRLQTAGYTSTQATAMYGLLTGMALLVVYMPTTVTAAISHTLTMKLVLAWQEQRFVYFVKNSRKAMELVWISGIISSSFLWIFNRGLSQLFFNSTQTAELIRCLSLIPLLVGIREVSTSILWAQENKKVSLIGTTIGITVATLSHYYLIPLDGFHLLGAVAGVLLMELTIMAGNLIGLRNVLKEIHMGSLAVHTLVIAAISALVIGLGDWIILPVNWGNYSILPNMLLFFLLNGVYLMIHYRFRS